MSDLNRLTRALGTLLTDLLPKLPYSYPYRYRVFGMAGNRVNLQIVRKSTGLPDILPAMVLPGVAGAWADLTPGSQVLVEFIEGDKAQPIVTHFEDRDSGGWKPVSLVLDASSAIKLGSSASFGVARNTDPVAGGTLAVVGGAGAMLQFTPPGGTPGTPSASVTLAGVISGASGKVFAE